MPQAGLPEQSIHIASVSLGLSVVSLKPRPVLHEESEHEAPMKPADARVSSAGRFEAVKLAVTMSISEVALFHMVT